MKLYTVRYSEFHPISGSLVNKRIDTTSYDTAWGIAYAVGVKLSQLAYTELAASITINGERV